ncbi:hypothetical protein [Phyllobacterium phragmitis]|uniref:Histidine kinase n=1 Tax=Phyllobacterium phragmitis TaxID=2670329 RepID=A0ABQ0GZU1_9HYPH
MLIFLLALSMMIAMTVSAVVLLVEENAGRQRVAEPVFDINSVRRLPHR